MPTFVLGGVSILLSDVEGGDDTFNGLTSFAITLPEGESLTYEYDISPNPSGDFVPQAIFGPENPPFNVSLGEDENDEVYFANIGLNDGTLLTILVIYDDSARTDNIFVLASTNPSFTFPTSEAAFAALEASIMGFAEITSGPFAPGAPMDFTAIFPATLITTSDDDTWIGTDEDETFDGGAGDDSLSGEGGDDEIWGGTRRRQPDGRGRQ